MTRLFGDMQIARFNELYYQHRSSRMRGWLKFANVVAALASSVVFAGLLKDGSAASYLGRGLWLALTAIAAVSAAIGPVFSLEDKIAQYEKAAMGYGIVRARIHSLLADLKLSEINDSHFARSKEIEAFESPSTALDDSSSASLKEKCWKQTLSEMPSDSAWNSV